MEIVQDKSLNLLEKLDPNGQLMAVWVINYVTLKSFLKQSLLRVSAVSNRNNGPVSCLLYLALALFFNVFWFA